MACIGGNRKVARLGLQGGDIFRRLCRSNGARAAFDEHFTNAESDDPCSFVSSSMETKWIKCIRGD